MPSTTSTVPTVALTDGRTLSYAVHGAADGPWLVHQHGTGSSRLEGELLHDVAVRHGIRVVTIDRPSYGDSTPADDRALMDWPDDVLRVCDELGIEQFHVSGLSGGGPHALAVAAALPERVTGVVLINSGAPTFDEQVLAQAAPRDRKAWLLARDNPERFRRTISPLMSRAPGRITDLLARFLLPALDRQLASQPHVRAVLDRAGEEARRQPGRRFDEALLVWGPNWGFDPYAIDVPITVFAGEEDQGRAFGVKLARTAADGTLVSFPGGHLAFLAEEVLDRIAATVVRHAPGAAA